MSVINQYNLVKHLINTNIISKTTDQNYFKKFFRVFRVFGQIFAYFRVFRATKMNLGLFRVFMVFRVRQTPSKNILSRDISKFSSFLLKWVKQKIFFLEVIKMDQILYEGRQCFCLFYLSKLRKLHAKFLGTGGRFQMTCDYTVYLIYIYLL